MSHLLIKYATRKRPAKFLQAMENIQSTVVNPNYQVIVSIDSDDSEMINMVSERSFANTRIFINDNTGGKIGAINANVPLSGWDWLVNTSDDMVFMVKGWDDVMREKIRSVWGDSLDFFANFNDGFQGERLCTMSIIGREYYERFFYIYAPCYKSLSCDAEAYYVAKTLGKYHYFEDQLYKHMHPANIKGKSDQLYVENEKYAKQDADMYFKRMAKDFYIHNAGQTVFDKHKRRIR